MNHLGIKHCTNLINNLISNFYCLKLKINILYIHVLKKKRKYIQSIENIKTNIIYKVNNDFLAKIKYSEELFSRRTEIC